MDEEDKKDKGGIYYRIGCGVLALLLLLAFLLPGILIGQQGGENLDALFNLAGSGSGTGQGPLDEDCIEKINPKAKAWVDTVNRAAAKYKQDPALLMAQLQKESDFNPRPSLGGANGIAQFLPGTFTQMANLYDVDGNGDGREEYLNSHDQIFAQAAYNQYIQGYLRDEGVTVSTENVLAAYNAGQGAVVDFAKGTNYTGQNYSHLVTGGIPPWTEPRNYIRNSDPNKPGILDLYEKYRKCLGGGIDYDPGEVDYIVFHWTAGNYNNPELKSSGDTYHGSIYQPTPESSFVYKKNPNFRYTDYVAHTYGFNTKAIGINIAALGMGSNGSWADMNCYTNLLSGVCPPAYTYFPPTQQQLQALAQIIKQLAILYHIPIDKDHILSHGEVAMMRNYFPERWEFIGKNTQDCKHRKPYGGVTYCNYSEYIRQMVKTAVIPTGSNEELIARILHHPKIKFSYNDLKNQLSNLKNNTLSFILAAGDSGNGDIQVTSLTGGGHINENGIVSFHYTGNGVDLAPNSNLQTWIYNNAQNLEIDELFGPDLTHEYDECVAAKDVVDTGSGAHIHVGTIRDFTKPGCRR